MRSSLIEVLDIGSKGPLQLLLMQDEQVIEAFLPHTSQEALADGIGSGCTNRRFQDLDRARFRHTSKTRSKLAIVIANQVLRCLPIQGGFAQLLCPRDAQRGVLLKRSGSRPSHMASAASVPSGTGLASSESLEEASPFALGQSILALLIHSEGE